MILKIDPLMNPFWGVRWDRWGLDGAASASQRLKIMTPVSGGPVDQARFLSVASGTSKLRKTHILHVEMHPSHGVSEKKCWRRCLLANRVSVAHPYSTE